MAATPTLPLFGQLLLPLDVGQGDTLLGHSEVHQGGGGQGFQLKGVGDGFLDGWGPAQRLHVHRAEVQDVADCKGEQRAWLRAAGPGLGPRVAAACSSSSSSSILQTWPQLRGSHLFG